MKILSIKVLIEKLEKEDYFKVIDKILSIILFEFDFICQNVDEIDRRNIYSVKDLKKNFSKKINDLYLYKIEKFNE